MSNNLSGIVLAVVILVFGVAGGVWWYQDSKEMRNDTKGEVYFGITDETASIENVNEINMEIEKVEMHSVANGWATISSDSKSYNLLDLKAKSKTELYASGELEAGAYDIVRVTLGDTVVKTKTNGDVKAYMPSRQIVMNMDVNVEADADTHVELDFLADQSLHSTAEAQYVFTPVVNAQSESGTTVTIGEDNAVTSTRGTIDSSVSVGVDIDGRSRKDFSLVTGSDFKVDASNGSGIKFMIGGETYTESDVTQEESVNGVRIDTDDEEDEMFLEVDGALNLNQ